mgnify:CR=1 FL=1
MAEDPQQSARKQLLSSAAAGSAAFEISGVLELSEPLEVYFKDHNNKLGTVSHPAGSFNNYGMADLPMLSFGGEQQKPLRST